MAYTVIEPIEGSDAPVAPKQGQGNYRIIQPIKQPVQQDTGTKFGMPELGSAAKSIWEAANYSPFALQESPQDRMTIPSFLGIPPGPPQGPATGAMNWALKQINPFNIATLGLVKNILLNPTVSSAAKKAVGGLLTAMGIQGVEKTVEGNKPAQPGLPSGLGVVGTAEGGAWMGLPGAEGALATILGDKQTYQEGEKPDLGTRGPITETTGQQTQEALDLAASILMAKTGPRAAFGKVQPKIGPGDIEDVRTLADKSQGQPINFDAPPLPRPEGRTPRGGEVLGEQFLPRQLFTPQQAPVNLQLPGDTFPLRPELKVPDPRETKGAGIAPEFIGEQKQGSFDPMQEGMFQPIQREQFQGGKLGSGPEQPEFEGYLRAAVRFPNGEVQSAKSNERMHAQIYQRLLEEGHPNLVSRNDPDVESGWADSSGKFFTNDEVQKQVGYKPDTFGSGGINIPQKTKIGSGPTLDPEKLRPAIQLGDRILIGRAGDTHADVLERNGYPAESVPHTDTRRGFAVIGEDGKPQFLSRLEAQAKSGIGGTAKAGGLDSMDLPGAARAKLERMMEDQGNQENRAPRRAGRGRGSDDLQLSDVYSGPRMKVDDKFIADVLDKVAPEKREYIQALFNANAGNKDFEHAIGLNQLFGTGKMTDAHFEDLYDIPFKVRKDAGDIVAAIRPKELQEAATKEIKQRFSEIDPKGTKRWEKFQKDKGNDVFRSGPRTPDEREFELLHEHWLPTIKPWRRDMLRKEVAKGEGTLGIETNFDDSPGGRDVIRAKRYYELARKLFGRNPDEEIPPTETTPKLASGPGLKGVGEAVSDLRKAINQGYDDFIGGTWTKEQMARLRDAVDNKAQTPEQEQELKKVWIGQLRDLKMPDGKGVVAPQATGSPPRGYVTRNVAGVRIAVHEGAKNMFDSLEDKGLRNPLLKGVYKTEMFLKHKMLAFDAYHAFRIARKTAFLTGDYPRYMNKALVEMTPDEVKEAVKRGDMDADDQKFYDENHVKAQMYIDGGLNVRQWANEFQKIPWLDSPFMAGGVDINPFSQGRKFNSWVFDKLSRSAMLQVALYEDARTQAAHPDWSEQQRVAHVVRQSNIYLGNLGRQGFIRSKSMQQLAQIAFLAPQWVEALGRSEAGAYTQLAKAAGKAATGKGVSLDTQAKGVGTGILAYLVANQIINMGTRGHPTWENKEKGHMFDAYIPPIMNKSKGFWLSPFSDVAEMTHDFIRYGREGKGPVSSAAKIVQNKLSPVARAEEVLRTGRDYAGRRLNDEERLKGALSAVIPTPLPISGIVSGGPGQLQRQALSTIGLKVEPYGRREAFEGKTIQERLQEIKNDRKNSKMDPAGKVRAVEEAIFQQQERSKEVVKGLERKDRNWIESRNMSIPGFSTNIRVGNIEVPLTPDEQKQMVEDVKGQTKEIIGKLRTDASFNGLPQEQQQEVFNAHMRRIAAIARNKIHKQIDNYKGSGNAQSLGNTQGKKRGNYTILQP